MTNSNGAPVYVAEHACIRRAGTLQARARHHTLRSRDVLQVLGVARRQPEQLHRFMAASDAAQLADNVVGPLAGALQATLARSGATQPSPGFVQDAVNAAAATVAAYGTALLDA